MILKAMKSDCAVFHGNLTELLKQYKGLSTYVAKHFQESRKALLEK